MFRTFLQTLRMSFLMLLVLSILTGLLYPMLITGIGQWLFKSASNGSIGLQGSTLIGQTFTTPDYFWGRPSATSPYPDNAASSSGSNLAPSNPAFVQAVQARLAALQQIDPTNKAPIPIDLVTASASGLDPQISVAAANYQVARVARLRHLPVVTVQQLVVANTQSRLWGLLGEPRVNVLPLNSALDQLTRTPHG